MDAVRLLGSLLGNNATGGNLLGALLKQAGGAQQAPAQSNNPLGALGGLLGGAMGGGGGQQGGGGLFGTLAKAAMGGALGGGGAAPQAAPPQPKPGAGGLLGALLGGGKPEQPEMQSREAVDEATLLIRAMCNAAKADGQVDQQEQQNIVSRLGDVSDAERDFVMKELQSPLDVNSFVASVPAQLAPQVYALSVMTVKVDTRQEAQYLNDLGQGLKLDQQTLGAIHQQLGVA